MLMFFSLEQCKELGIYSRLDQVFDAPNAVKEVMIGQFGLQNSVCICPILYYIDLPSLTRKNNENKLAVI